MSGLNTAAGGRGMGTVVLFCSCRNLAEADQARGWGVRVAPLARKVLDRCTKAQSESFWPGMLSSRMKVKVECLKRCRSRLVLTITNAKTVALLP